MRFFIIAQLLPLLALQSAAAPPIPGSVLVSDGRLTLTGCGNTFAATTTGLESVTLKQ